MAVNNTTNLAPGVRDVLNERFLAQQQFNCINSAIADLVDMPDKGDTMVFERIERLDPVTEILATDGSTKAGATANQTDIRVTIGYYGNHYVITRDVPLQAGNAKLNELNKNLGINMRESEDVNLRRVYESAGTLLNCVYGVNGGSPTELSLKDFQKVATLLKGNGAQTYLDPIEGTNRYGTGPINNAFIGLMHTDLCTDLRTIEGFRAPVFYGDSRPFMRSEEGAVDQVRVLQSPLGTKLPGAAADGSTLYKVYISGIDAVKMINQDSWKKQLRYQPATDPYGMYPSLSWSTSFGAAIVQPLWFSGLNATKRF